MSICEYCQQPHDRTTRWGHPTKYCSPLCKQKADTARRPKMEARIIECAYCGADIEAKGERRKFCSKECSQKLHYQEKHKRLESERKANYTPKPCEFCGEPISFERASGRKRPPLYCSPECYQKAKDRRRSRKMAVLFPSSAAVEAGSAQDIRHLRGAAAEMIVAADLMTRGWLVSRPMTGASHYDLVADTGEKMLRVEVKLAKKNAKGYLQYDSAGLWKKREKGLDLVAFVLLDEQAIQYNPPLEDL